MGKIEIQLVRVDGMLVGRRIQDRFNLMVLGVSDDGIEWSRNQSALKKLRRDVQRVYGDDFVFTTVKQGEIVKFPTTAEVEVMGQSAYMVPLPLCVYLIGEVA